MLFARRSLLATAGTLPFFNIRRARAAEFSYRFANTIAVQHPFNIRAAEAITRITEKTQGRVEITLHPNNELGNDTELLRKLRAAEVEMIALTASVTGSFVPSASIGGIAFAFKEYRQVWAAMDGKLGSHIRAEIAKSGFFAMGRIWDNGFRQITTSTKPVRTPDDLRGMKLRVPVSPLWTSTFTAFGTTPASLNFTEVYQALKNSTVDGQENPLALIQVAKFFEVQSFCSLTSHMWDGFWQLTNGDAWARMPGDLREIVEAEFNRAALEERADLIRLSPAIRGDLVDAGLLLNAVDMGPFRRILQEAGYYADWRHKYGDVAWKLLEEVAGSLS